MKIQVRALRWPEASWVMYTSVMVDGAKEQDQDQV